MTSHLQAPAPALPSSRRRLPVRLSLTFLLAIGLLLPAGTTLASGEVELTGDVVVEYAEDFDKHRIERWVVLETGKGGRFRLEGNKARDLESGMRVRVRGRSRGNETIDLAAAGGSVTPLGTSTGSTTSASGGTRRVAVLLMRFSSDVKPWTKSQVADLYFNSTRSVRNYFKEVSHDQLNLTGAVFGWYTIKGNTTSCRQSEWATAGREAATAAGVNLAGYDYIVHAFPRVSACWWGGLAQVAGQYSWINGAMTPYVTMHEMGHNLGAHHASSLTCTEHGVRVPLSDNCSVSEYGDPHDVMGQNASGPKKQRHLHAWHRRQVGFLGSSEMRTVTSNGHYEISPAQLAGGAPRLVRVPRPASNDYFYLEFRRPYGFFDDYSTTAHAVNGVLVRIAPASARVPSRLIDMNPATSGFADAALAVGQSFSDAANGISLRTMSVNTTRAVVRIQVGPDTQPPTAPGNLQASIEGSSSVTLSWSAAKDDLEVAGYRIRRDGVLVGSVGSAARSYSQSSVPAGNYAYSVAAVDGAGNQGPAASVSVSLGTNNLTAKPTVPGKLTGKALDRRYVQLSWQASSGGSGTITYRIFRNDVRIAKGVTKTTYRDRAPSVGNHTYKVRAVDSKGNKSAFTPKITVKAVKVAK